MQKVVELVENEIEWCGLKLRRESGEDYFKSRGRPFEWEVDATPDEDDGYAARVYFNGVKLASGRGSTRYAALTKALQWLSNLETQIGNETYTRREGGRAFKKRHYRDS